MSEDLSFQDIEELLESITHNRKLVKIEDGEGSKYFRLSYPNSEEVFMSRYRRAVALEEAESLDLPSLEDIAEFITSSDIISEEDHSEIKVLEEKILAQKRLLKLTTIIARRQPIEKQVSQFSDRIREIKSKGDNYKYLSKEVKADEEAMLYLTWASFHTLGGSRYWNTFQEFENETDLIFRSEAIKLFSEFNQGMSVKTVRAIARNGLWRVRYTAATKTGSTLFNLSELTPDQQGLLYWTNYYQSIYEMLPDDQPDEDTIIDDDELDDFMERFYKRREKERKQGRVKSGKGKLSAGTKDEVIITANHPDYQNTKYSEERISSLEGESDVEVVSPNSKRARNRLGTKRNRR